MKKSADPWAEKIRNIYFSIGVAITQWQYVELELTQLFSILVNAKPSGVASAVFSSVLNFNTKLKMVEAAAFVTLRDTPLFKECEEIQTRLEKKARKRNQIAHFMLHQKALMLSALEPELARSWARARQRLILATVALQDTRAHRTFFWPGSK